MNSMRQLIVIGALIIGTLGITVPSAFADTDSSYGPDGSGRTTYNTSKNHYEIYDTKKDSHAVAVKFYRPGGTLVGFQSCHEGAGNRCPGDLPKSLSGPLCMKTGVGLGPDQNNYAYGGEVCFQNA